MILSLLEIPTPPLYGLTSEEVRARSGNDTEERRTLLSGRDASTLVQEARKLREPGKPGT